MVGREPASWLCALGQLCPSEPQVSHLGSVLQGPRREQMASSCECSRQHWGSRTLLLHPLHMHPGQDSLVDSLPSTPWQGVTQSTQSQMPIVLVPPLPLGLAS